MSRNLCKTNCDYCGIDAVTITGTRYVEGARLLAEAECQACGSKYTAWLQHWTGDKIAGECNARNHPDHEDWFAKHDECFGCEGCTTPFFDLSYRSSFNDEPNEEDIPGGDIVKTIVIKKDGWRGRLEFLPQPLKKEV